MEKVAPKIQLPEPSEREQEEITAAKTRHIARRPRATVATIKSGKNKGLLSGPSHSDQAGWAYRALDALGTPSTDFLLMELQRIAGALNLSVENTERGLNAALAVVDGQRPKDEIEAQLVLQMAVTHATAIDMIARARRAESLGQLDSHGALGNKMLRTFARQVEALVLLRRGGKQVVQVEHVYRKRRKPGEGGAKKPAP